MQNFFGSQLGKDISRVCLYGIGFTSVASVIWLAGPLIVIGDYRPLDSYVTREILILLIGAVLAGVAGTTLYRRRAGSEDIARGISQDGKHDSDEPVLKERMRDALATLKNAARGRGGYLYDLPWYLLIGPPGSGKTTALVNSGLKFPLSRGATPAAIAGVGGTRYCDWWFTEEAVLIDTAGRYTTQDSDTAADRQSWLGFLDLLKKNRPKQPINGVLVAISLEDLITLSPAEINAHATAVRSRLLELHDRLKVDFPVYALFTKSDLVAGFVEFFGHLDDPARRQVWGATFQTSDKTRNMVGEVPVEFDMLIERLNFDMTDRLQDEPVPGTRVSLFGFPAQLAALKRPIFDFLNQIFEPTRYHANANLRGFYFTSGTQQGTPIDQLIGALVKSFGAEEVAGAAYSGVGKSFFLTDLVRKVIIGEAAWVSTDRAAVRRDRIIRGAAYGMLALVALGLSTAWWMSYARNRNLIAQTDVAVNQYRALAGPLARAAVIEDRALDKVLPLLHALRDFPAGYATRERPAALAAGFGLSQRERLQSSSESSYHVALERLFRPRLIYRLEEQLEANRDNTSFLYEALKVYLMIGGVQREDRELIVAWMRRDWTDNLYPGAGNEAGRKELEEHLLAMLALDGAQEPLVSINGPLIEEAQRTLARLSVAQRAYELLKSQASASSLDWVAARHGGPDFPLVFEAVGGPQDLDNVRVPAFFTYAGFRRLFLDRLGGIAEQLKRDSWLLGAAGAQPAVAVQYDTLGADLLDLYTKDFIDAWRQALGKLQMRPLTADRPKYIALAAAGAATSPLKQLLESIRDETALTRERPEFAKNVGAKGNQDLPTLLKQQGEAPGAAIEAAFKPIHVLVDGDATRRPIDEIVGDLHEIDRNLTLVATDPTQAASGAAALQNDVASLRTNANRMPSPFSDMLLKVASSFEGDLTNSSHDQLARELGNQVTGTCEQIVANRYPFTRGSDREVPLADFGRLFGPNGTIDRFFTQNLAALVDMSKSDWTWRQDSGLARTLAPAALAEFRRAAQIRDAFFATGGTMPSIVLSVTPPVLAGSGATARLEANGSVVESKQAAAAGSPGGSATATIQWPGAGPNRTAISVSQDAGGALALASTQFPSQPSTLERNGAWSLFRMIDAGSPAKRGDRVVATFLVGGRELQYQFSAGSVQNPLSLPALRDFRCPNRI
jgi:type VI secretion system protein ImpL